MLILYDAFCTAVEILRFVAPDSVPGLKAVLVLRKALHKVVAFCELGCQCCARACAG